MLCRNLFFLKSNQYSRSVSLNSWYIFVSVRTRLSNKLTPHFSLIKFLARRQFRQILKLPFFPVFTILSATFVLYFQTTYYRHVAGAEMAQFIPLPRGQTGPPDPRLPTQQGNRQRHPRHSHASVMRCQKCISKVSDQKSCCRKNEIHYSGASSIIYVSYKE